MKQWSHLPNAHHIDWVIQSLKANPDIWTRAWNATRNTAWREARDRALNAAWSAGRSGRGDATWDMAHNGARRAARNAILALVAYDDCDRYLAMTYEQLSVYAVLSDKPQALVLLSLKWVQENETVVTPT